MPYIQVPRWARFVEHSILVCEYICIFIAGILVIGHSANWMDIVGFIMCVGSMLAILGVLIDRYRLEWVALPFILTSLALGVIVMPGIASIAAGVLVFGFGIALGRRLLQLSLVARKLRAMPGVAK